MTIRALSTAATGMLAQQLNVDVISNNLASLQPNRVRYTKTVFIEFTADGVPVATEAQSAAIKSRRRFTYEEVDSYLEDSAPWKKKLTAAVFPLLGRMHELANILRRRRLARGAIELSLREVKLDLNKKGQVCGAHFVENTQSHQIIEEFMLAANEAVARLFHDRQLSFLRRIHEPPDPRKLKALTEFVTDLGIPTESLESRFELKRVIEHVAGRPEQHAVNYAVLRSFQKAIYSPLEVGHYALASDHYCHFTSPIRRYPDLMIHRLLDAISSSRKPESQHDRLLALGEHCSDREQRAAAAEEYARSLVVGGNEAVERILGLDVPVYVQYGRWMGDMFLHGNVQDPKRRYAIGLDFRVNQRVGFCEALPDFLNDPASWQDKIVEAGYKPSHYNALEFWDEINKEWVAMRQAPNHPPVRCGGRYASPDLKNWKLEHYIYPDAHDSTDPRYFDEIYGVMGLYTEGFVLGVLSWFVGDMTHVASNNDRGIIGKDTAKGTMEVRIVTSRDGGKTWDRTVSREAWIPHGTQQHSVSPHGLRQRIFGERGAVCLIGRPADQAFVNFEVEPPGPGEPVRHPAHLGHYLGPDPVSRHKQ